MRAGGGDYFGSIPYTEEEKSRIANLLRQNLGDEYISRREGPGGCTRFFFSPSMHQADPLMASM